MRVIATSASEGFGSVSRSDWARGEGGVSSDLGNHAVTRSMAGSTAVMTSRWIRANTPSGCSSGLMEGSCTRSSFLTTNLAIRRERMISISLSDVSVSLPLTAFWMSSSVG